MSLTKNEKGEWVPTDPNAPQNFANGFLVESKLVREHVAATPMDENGHPQHPQWALIKNATGPKKMAQVDFISSGKEQTQEIAKWVHSIDPHADLKLVFIESETDILGYTPSSGMPPEMIISEEQAKARAHEQQWQQLKKLIAEPSLRS